jgi:hypothetical protein
MYFGGRCRFFEIIKNAWKNTTHCCRNSRKSFRFNRKKLRIQTLSLKSKVFIIKNFNYSFLVLDEADRLLDKTIVDDIIEINLHLPKNK